MSSDLHIVNSLVIPEGELLFTATRAGGPGGQHVNKTSSRVLLTWSVVESTVLSARQRERIQTKLASRITKSGELHIAVDEHRSQFRNKEVAKERLRELLVSALKVPKKRIATKASKSSKRKRMEQLKPLASRHNMPPPKTEKK